MTKRQRVVCYSKEKAKLFQLLKEYITSEEFCQYDPVLKKAIELGRDKHLPFDKAVQIAKQELEEK